MENTNSFFFRPTATVPLMASVTKNLAFGLTISTLAEPPYHLARRLATLDHLSKGRIGWNIVTTFTNSASRNNLNGQDLAVNTDRYARADEYVDVIYELLLSSWRDDAVLNDKAKRIYADPDGIRKINFEGKHFTVPGYQFTEPSPQRLPLIIQAGGSPPGEKFGARVAELVFVNEDTPEKLRTKIDRIKKLAHEEYGRNPDNLKFVSLIEVYIAETTEEAYAKFEDILQYVSEEGAQVLFGGWTGVDLSPYDWDEDLRKIAEANPRSHLKSLVASPVKITRRDLVNKITGKTSKTTFIGSVKEVADQIEDLVDKSGLDGFNFAYNLWPGSFEDIVDLLLPELRKRGLAWDDYPVQNGTFRENFYGQKGQTFVPEDHSAFGYKWNSGVSKEQFEKDLKAYKEKNNRL
ncbi:putative monooxygenase [Wickerhamomyces ciferrii]|uniref:Monooxygenase n=1 Tax=Wickerhamomyces ciferrii (strain ATCC 14091 / BCRC 22168 / CBS 111 / JCM 3599 / NBRC 0793 / NRRL Y-1031 F-60-10) TaxID=1206466 RepID=K0KXA8_WICCF|nr:putative monooxygenase [Wickerhamomyces ciferrii]CCH46672.1 putative monooxygenase [Wickerhamomyces ciferrii]